MKLVDFEKVNITGGFWKTKEKLNREVTINAVYDRFADTGRFKAFECKWKEGEPQKPHFFWDSDVAKWIEAASFVLAKNDYPELSAKVESVIDNIEKNRDESGYFNIYFTVVEPQSRFTRRTDHELYCAGHLIEAAVAYAKATGKDRFLKLMEDYADCIHREFVEKKSARFVTPGHEEIELALIKLYRFTGKEKYLKLAGFFLDNRGANSLDTEYDFYSADGKGSQSHLPVRKQTTAEGHAVRAGYLYAAMADYAAETGDADMEKACHAIFNDIVKHKMYITGAAGSTYLGEAFTIPYDLPNPSAYAETCAAIALMFFANRMLRLDNSADYADTVERAMYNGMLSGVSLNGKAFFYENPLEINLKQFSRNTATSTRERYPITQRLEIFGCSCCPPNINRMLASIGAYAYGVIGKTLYVNQFMQSDVEADGIKASVETNFPLDGKLSIKTEGAESIAVRIPYWAKSFVINAPYTMKNGYAVTVGVPEIEVCFDMNPRLVQANPLVWDDAGKATLMMGPVVYCLEGVDNKDELHSLYIEPNGGFEIVHDDYFGLPKIVANGYVKKSSENLYCDYKNDDFEMRQLTFIPYSAFANRGESDMLVWVNVKN